MLNHPLENILVRKHLFHSYIFTKESKQMAFAKASNNTTPILRFCFTWPESRFFSMVTLVRYLNSQQVSMGHYSPYLERMQCIQNGSRIVLSVFCAIPSLDVTDCQCLPDFRLEIVSKVILKRTKSQYYSYT